MAWTYSLNPELPFVAVEFSGNITARDLKEATSALISLEKGKGINRFLIDCTDMVLEASLLDVYNLPAKQYIDENADRNGRVALVFPESGSPKEKEAVQFYETVCTNRGWDVRAFSEHPDAVAWLTRGV